MKAACQRANNSSTNYRLLEIAQLRAGVLPHAAKLNVMCKQGTWLPGEVNGMRYKSKGGKIAILKTNGEYCDN